MPQLDRDEACLVVEVVPIELGAEQEGVSFCAAMLCLDIVQQALDPRRGRLPTTKAPVHAERVLAVRQSDKPVGRPCRLLRALANGRFLRQLTCGRNAPTTIRFQRKSWRLWRARGQVNVILEV